jgi:hypothetical protein
MKLVIPFTPTEEEQLSAAAKQTGLAPAELIRRLTLDHLPPVAANAEEEIDAKLRQWQEKDGTILMPDVSTRTLFAQWADEDMHMTDEEREAEDRLWQDFENSIHLNRTALGSREL